MTQKKKPASEKVRKTSKTAQYKPKVNIPLDFETAVEALLATGKIAKKSERAAK